MAGQFCKDLTYSTDLAKNWSDRHNFAAPGPGSKKAVRCMYGIKIGSLADNSLDLFCKAVMEARELLLDNGFDKEFPELAGRMDLMDYQNCLCEFYKYWALLNGKVKRTRIYTW